LKILQTRMGKAS